MPTPLATTLHNAEQHGPIAVEFHSEAEFLSRIEDAYADGAHSLTCETPADDQTARAMAARAGVICARRVQDGVAKWVLLLRSRERAA